ncbi:MAG: Asp-tRNA(Asn)/Glu-tRNA(Gln) amidotransferase subunit GatC [Ruminococcaceae bacterium]|nr:Asp-tRNA(Asn)/Glu-tRNA(Gln) amidotransferase subunit GatC [Oscillospiraceae bacterium]HHV31816.1 Asp-tRNA(Asn)/Glu-tRNA(Gln) amidotransferase subunit GatC [Clostridiales bacterium]
MVTHEEIRKIARLAKLSISDDELDRLTKDMSEIIGFADTINAVSPDASDFDNINNLSNAFREDTVVPSYDQEEILKNAPNQEDGYFLVKKRV